MVNKRGNNEGRGPSEGEAYGVAGLTMQLEGIGFPISKKELINKFGDKQFQWTKGGETLRLRDCLREAPEEINSITQVTHWVSVANKHGALSR